MPHEEETEEELSLLGEAFLAEAEAQAIADVLREERRVSMAATSATLWRARAAAKEGVDDSGAVDLADIDVAGSAATGAAAKSTLGDLARVWCLRVRVVSFAHAIPVLRREAERVHQGSKGAVPARRSPPPGAAPARAPPARAPRRRQGRRRE